MNNRVTLLLVGSFVLALGCNRTPSGDVSPTPAAKAEGATAKGTGNAGGPNPKESSAGTKNGEAAKNAKEVSAQPPPPKEVSAQPPAPKASSLQEDRQKLIGNWQAPREPLDDGWRHKSLRFGKGDFTQKGDHETMLVWVMKASKVFDGTLSGEQQEFSFGPLSEKDGKRFIEVVQSKIANKTLIQIEYKFVGEKLVLKAAFKMEDPEVKGRGIDVDLTGDWLRLETKKNAN